MGPPARRRFAPDATTRTVLDLVAARFGDHFGDLEPFGWAVTHGAALPLFGVPASIARALIDGLKDDIPADDAALRALVPQRLLDFREAVSAALGAERQHRVPGRWTEEAFALRRFRHDYGFYAKRAGATIVTGADRDALWRVVTSIGGRTGYFTMNWIWRLREGIDWLLGSRGFSRGRRGVELRLGDSIDHWTVVGLEPGRVLTLDFGLKAPGAGILEFAIDPAPGGRTRLGITAYWHPQGVWSGRSRGAPSRKARAMVADVRVDVRRSGVRFDADASLDLSADPATVWATITDYDALPRFMPAIQACRVLERRPQPSGREKLVVQQQGEFRFMAFAVAMNVRIEVEQDIERVATATRRGQLRGAAEPRGTT